MSDKDALAVAKECETVRLTIGDRISNVATVTIDRPEQRNAIDERTRQNITAVFAALEDTEVRVVVLTGTDETAAFVAGGDITEMRERSPLEQREASKRPRIYEVVEEFPMPVIARINGHALGGGCELAQACDIRIAKKGGKLGQPEINLGIMPGGGGTQRLPRLVGSGHAMRLILSGELIEADEAAEIGLVEEVHQEGDFDERVYDLAGNIAEKSPVALEVAKRAVNAHSRMNLDAGLQHETELFVQLFATEDKNEGMDAFLENRQPQWSGE